MNIHRKVINGNNLAKETTNDAPTAEQRIRRLNETPLLGFRKPEALLRGQTAAQFRRQIGEAIRIAQI